jgi:hypothetical protein
MPGLFRMPELTYNLLFFHHFKSSWFQIMEGALSCERAILFFIPANERGCLFKNEIL